MNKAELSRHIKEKAKEIGFISCGISKAGFLEEEAPILEKWLNQNYHGKMGYMANHFDKRLDPTKLVDGAKSVISVLLNYFPEKDLFDDQPLKISKYAYGEDYHFVLKSKLAELLSEIQDQVSQDISARVFTDSAPVLDKAWAAKSGLGWIGKNANLLSKQVGSFFFIGEIILDVDLDYDAPIADHCGTCTKCIDACPTEAIVAPYVVDGSKCISYLTIELKDEIIPNQFKDKMDGWFFGCDVCQDVCPWNRFSTPHQHDEFSPKEGFSEIEWIELTQEIFNKFFKKSAVKRTKYNGLKRNIEFVKQS
ncbi:MAG: tRNA epoxyqueuosine(34) reductase QueG [Crocinitomicaceae bacterium]|nr:tRNA epoxyqueuosine(34) reductase QueG [Crocinitomicaceae bacterium]